MTQFKKGESGNPEGRPKGSKNKATIAIERLLEQHNHHPIEGMIEIAKIATERAKKEGRPENQARFLAIAANMEKELAQYIAPKRRAIETRLFLYAFIDGGSSSKCWRDAMERY